MEPLGDELRRELGRLGGPAGGDLGAIASAWPLLAGETVARNAWPVRIARDGALHVATSSATWAFELGRLAPTFLERFRERLGDAAPPSLRFAPGPLPERPQETSRSRPQPPSPAPEERELAAALVAGIGDAELRALVARAAAASLARARDDRGF